MLLVPGPNIEDAGPGGQKERPRDGAQGRPAGLRPQGSAWLDLVGRGQLPGLGNPEREPEPPCSIRRRCCCYLHFRGAGLEGEGALRAPTLEPSGRASLDGPGTAGTMGGGSGGGQGVSAQGAAMGASSSHSGRAGSLAS